MEKVTNKSLMQLLDEAIENCGHERVRKELIFTTKIIEKDLNLGKCTFPTIIDCVNSVVKCGLSLNPVLNLCYLSASENNVCRLEISYLGFIKILKDSGSVKHIDAHIIYDDEQFNEDTSTGTITHEKKYAKTEGDQKKRNIIGVYCVAILPDNTRIFSQVIPGWEVEKRRNTTTLVQNADSPWERWKEDMYKKTGIRMWWKFLIQGDVGDQISAVLEIDNNNSGFETKHGKVSQKKSLKQLF